MTEFGSVRVAVDVMVDACREHRVVCAIGVNERESERPGSLYNALLILPATDSDRAATAAPRPGLRRG